MSWAQTCFDKIGVYLDKIKTDIPKHWVAGLISVECARLDPKASRFEPLVYESVKCVKNGGKSKAFPGFNSGAIYNYIQSENNETNLKALATSWGLGQLMGYHYINKWSIKPEAFMNLTMEASLRSTVLFMEIGYNLVKVDGTYSDKEFERLLRWHNTGSATGKTYHANYVANATKQAYAFKALLESKTKDISEKTKDNEEKVEKIVLLEKKVADLEDRIEKLEKIING